MLIKKKLPLLKLDLQTFAGDPPPTDPPATPPADPPAPKTYDEDYVKSLRDEAAKYRKKAKELETNSTTQQQDLINKVFTAFGINPDPNVEFEKQLSTAQQQAQAAEKRANDRLIQAEIKAIGTGLHLVDLDAVDKLVDKSSFAVKEDGSVEGVKEALEQLAADKPYLVKDPGEPKPSGYVPGAQQKGNNPTPDDAYAKAKADAKRLLDEKKIKL